MTVTFRSLKTAFKTHDLPPRDYFRIPGKGDIVFEEYLWEI